MKKIILETSNEIVENSIETVKSGVFSIVNGIILKIILGFTLIILLTAGGCVGTNILIDKIKQESNSKN